MKERASTVEQGGGARLVGSSSYDDADGSNNTDCIGFEMFTNGRKKNSELSLHHKCFKNKSKLWITANKFMINE